MKYWIKIDRLAAWVLLVGMTLYFISGYGMTRGIIDASFATKVHIDLLSIVVIIAFVLHAGFATRLALIRWKAWNDFGKTLWAAFFITFLLGFIYIDKIYQPKSLSASGSLTDQTAVSIRDEHNSKDNESENASSSSRSSRATNSSQINSAVPAVSSQKTFSKAELAKFNGKNGAAAYVAVDGKVYDLTAVFSNGSHFSHIAGSELTNAFYSKHAKPSITKYPIVGDYTG